MSTIDKWIGRAELLLLGMFYISLVLETVAIFAGAKEARVLMRESVMHLGIIYLVSRSIIDQPEAVK